ncbi:16S rRNA (cytidine(1402)-2'-O)-methyltransferase [Roseicyclus persicicus]|uniref:Ribosomal RNA small subunit methyltransferase I n=1 Tax=Roseicyclus persicicus TaxID=2650661 RepID=A0A7X6GYP1_9RHOB|nr:16S rRNA (cytidine(1402)-2'-O)-methyltransferase [Roseibacterium persicicum]NKX44104.1 16S rRNA (cytidine(1402)-2'-O)-methyltransferase [Roseibacterium persicicum]
MDEHGQATGGRRAELAPGLYLVATPIGAARDITLRALDILATAEVLAAEDTRTLRHLMDIHGIKLGDRPLIAYHDHNGAEARPRILRALSEGRSVAYCSEAGTPVVADPGYQLARAAIGAGLPVTAAPGPSAAIMALSLSGLPSDRFLFAGFPPAQAGARARWLDEIGDVPATLILYESPKRISRLLGELCEAWGADRPAALCRELTKRFEEVRRGTLGALRDGLAEAPVKGEIALVVGRPLDVAPEAADVEAALREALGRLRVKEAAAEVAEALGLPRRDVYQMALALKDAGGPEDEG